MSQKTASDSIQVVSFSLLNQSSNKKEDYAIPIEQVKEIRTLEEITEVPKAKSYVKGIMNLRGLIIPIIDVKDKLGFGSGEINKSKQRILVADIKDSLYGLLVDDVDQVMRIPTEDIGPVPSGAFESYSYVKGIAKTHDKLIVVLDVATLIEDSEVNSKDFTNQSSNSSSSPESKTNVQDDTSDNVKEELPEELKEVFEEDEKGIAPQEISQG